MKRIAGLAAGLLTFTFAAQASVTFVRSMDVTQVGPDAYEVTCYVEFSGIDATHDFTISVFGETYGIATTYPYGADVGPTMKRVRLSEPGVWDFTATLRKGTLTATRVMYLNQTPPPSSSSYCQGGALDKSTGTPLPAFLMYDYFR